MTAINLIVQDRAAAAYLLTDTAAFNDDGTISYFAPKAVAIELTDGSAAFAVAGRVAANRALREIVARQPVCSTSEFLDLFPRIFRDAEEHLLAAGRKRESIAVVVAVFDRTKGRPQGFVIGNDNTVFPLGAYRPYTLQPSRKYLTRYAGYPFSHDVDICRPSQWNPQRDGAALLDAQRKDLSGQPEDEYSVVGGQAVLTTISAEGVQHRTLKTWPDRIGRRIDLSAGESHLYHRFRGRVREVLNPPVSVKLSGLSQHKPMLEGWSWARVLRRPPVAGSSRGRS